MRNIVVAIAVMASLALFAGCRKPPSSYGNFAKAESADLVRDALTVMLSTYPPAKTRLNLLQPADDLFGLRLIESLRGNGYAVAEYAPPIRGGKVFAETDVSGLGFGYVLDRLHDGGELRVTLHVGNELLSRLYQVQGMEEDARCISAGFWVRRQEETHAGQ